jgi:hypothetical protein
MHCINCDYSLNGLEGSRCPECGRIFDAKDPRTFRPLPAERRRLLAKLDAKSNLSPVIWCGCIAGLFAVIDFVATDMVLIQFTGCFGLLALFGLLIIAVRVIRILRGWLPDRKY